MRDYNKQADAFCAKYDITISKTLIKHDKYFIRDKEKRDIYEITINRKGYPAWTFTFGQSINNSARPVPKAVRERLDNACFFTYSDRQMIAQWMNVDVSRIRRNGQIMAVEPTNYDILACLEKGGALSFVDFCDSFGYDSDSITAKTTWEGWLVEALKVEALFGDCLDALQDIQ